MARQYIAGSALGAVFVNETGTRSEILTPVYINELSYAPQAGWPALYPQMPFLWKRPLKAMLATFAHVPPQQVPTLFVANAWGFAPDRVARGRFPVPLQQADVFPWQFIISNVYGAWTAVEAPPARRRPPASGAEVFTQPAAATYLAWVESPTARKGRTVTDAAAATFSVVPSAAYQSWVVEAPRWLARRVAGGSEGPPPPPSATPSAPPEAGWQTRTSRLARPPSEPRQGPHSPPPVDASPKADLWSSISYGFRTIRPPEYPTPPLPRGPVIRIISQPTLYGRSTEPTLYGASTSPTLYGRSTEPGLRGKV